MDIDCAKWNFEMWRLQCLCRVVVVVLNDGGGGSEVEGDANVKKKF